MSIPVTASTEAFTPACMAEIEGAPTFTFRHATVLDKTRFHELKAIAKLRSHAGEQMREVVLHELRKLFTSDGMEQNITRLEAYWAAIDDHEAAIKEHREFVIQTVRAAEEGADIELPPEPVIDFPAGEIIELNALVDQVERHSDIYAELLADNIRFNARYPRLLLRMFLTSSSLPVTITRDKEGIITPESAEQIIEALAKEARSLSVDSEVAVSQLLLKAMLSFALSEDEEKNSSSPLSGISSPEQSAKEQSSGKTAKSNVPAISDETDGLNSSDSGNPAQE